jgi:hypothetical protein
MQGVESLSFLVWAEGWRSALLLGSRTPGPPPFSSISSTRLGHPFWRGRVQRFGGSDVFGELGRVRAYI